MADSPVLKTPRLSVMPFQDVHLTARYVGWLNDREVMRYSENRHRTHTLASCRAYVQSFQDTPHHLWAIIAHNEALGHLGNMNAYVSAHDAVADVGILIGEKRAWGQGYGLEAWRAVCAYLLGAGGMRKVTAGTIAPNKAMLRLMDKAGMLPDGRRVRQQVWEGQAVDVIHTALFKNEDE